MTEKLLGHGHGHDIRLHPSGDGFVPPKAKHHGWLGPDPPPWRRIRGSVLHLTIASSPISPVWRDTMKQTATKVSLLRMAALLGLGGLLATSACGDLPPLPVAQALDGGATDGWASPPEAARDSAVGSGVDAPAAATDGAETKPPIDASMELVRDSATASPLDASEALAADARPASPMCAAGEVQAESDSCGNCGQGTVTRTRLCRADLTWDSWSGWSACSNPEECVPDKKDTESKTCGACSKGTQSHERTCSTSCTWDAWSSWSACNEIVDCQPGGVTTQSVACSACGGSMTQQRTCSSSCTWGDWTDTSSCDVSCCATLMYCNASRATNPVPGRGTWCRKKTAACSQDEVTKACHQVFLQKCPPTDSFEPVYYD
jgi:hypothetical protein